MITLTEGATEAIQQLVGDRPGAGLRIFPQQSDSDRVQLGLSIANGPQPSDEVVEDSGCQVFLDSEVAPLVDGHVLDARAEGERVEFAFVA